MWLFAYLGAAIRKWAVRTLILVVAHHQRFISPQMVPCCCSHFTCHNPISNSRKPTNFHLPVRPKTCMRPKGTESLGNSICPESPVLRGFTLDIPSRCTRLLTPAFRRQSDLIAWKEFSAAKRGDRRIKVGTAVNFAHHTSELTMPVRDNVVPVLHVHTIRCKSCNHWTHSGTWCGYCGTYNG